MTIQDSLNHADLIQIMLVIPVVLVSVLYPYKLNDKGAVLIISPVVCFSLYLLFQHSPPPFIYVPIAFMGGILSFVLSIWLTHEDSLLTVLKEYTSNISGFFQSQYKQFDDWNSVIVISLMVVYEELVWRLFLVETLSLYLSGIPIILLASFLSSFSSSLDLSFLRLLYP